MLYMCPHTAAYAIYVSSYCYICVLILLYMCRHTAAYVVILLHMCPHTTMCVLVLLCTCPYTATCVSSFCSVCVLVQQYIQRSHATIYVSSHTQTATAALELARSTTICVSSYCNICVLIERYILIHALILPDRDGNTALELARRGKFQGTLAILSAHQGGAVAHQVGKKKKRLLPPQAHVFLSSTVFLFSIVVV
jgi:hypothetical protein